MHTVSSASMLHLRLIHQTFHDIKDQQAYDFYIVNERGKYPEKNCIQRIYATR